MLPRALPPLPGVDPATAPDDPRFADWLERTVFSPGGVDRSLIWESLHRTPAERLATLQEFVDAFHARTRTIRPGRGKVRSTRLGVPRTRLGRLDVLREIGAGRGRNRSR